MKIKKAMASILTLALLLIGCKVDDSDYGMPDQALRRQIFKECLAAIPKGPERTVYNDWAEVVSECESAAYYQSIKLDRKASR